MVHLKIFNKTPINYTYSVTYSGPVTLNILNGKLHSVYCALSLFFQHTLDDITKAIFVAFPVRCYNFNADMLCQGKVETG